MSAMQATVRSFNQDTRAGSVLLDDGSEVAFDAEAFRAGGLRLLRPGQRVRLQVSPAGDIVTLTILTMMTPAAPGSSSRPH